MPPRLVLPIHAGPPPEPPYGGLGDEGWSRGATFFEFATAAGPTRDAIEAAFRELVLAPELAAFLGAYPHRARILALADAQDVRACRLVAYAERCCVASSNLWMRIFAPSASEDLVARYAPANEPLPRLVFFGEDRREFARWGPESGADADIVTAMHRILAAAAGAGGS